MNRFEQDAHRHGTMKRRFRNHSRTPCLLARRTKEDPHPGQTKRDITASPFLLSCPPTFRRCILASSVQQF